MMEAAVTEDGGAVREQRLLGGLITDVLQVSSSSADLLFFLGSRSSPCRWI
jgi:hypothetical protein